MCFLNYGQYICHRATGVLVVVLCFVAYIIWFLFGCQYQHNHTYPQNDLLCVKWYINLYSLLQLNKSNA